MQSSILSRALPDLPSTFAKANGDLPAEQKIAIVRVDMRIPHEFSYRIPEELKECVIAGSRVRVPFGARKIAGTVLSIQSSSDYPFEKLKPVSEVIGIPALLPSYLLKIAEWMSVYYLCPLDLVLRSIAPAIVQKKSSMRHRTIKKD